MPHREEILNELGRNAPNLRDIKSDGFRVPEGYFEDLPDLVFARIAQEELIVPERTEQQGFFEQWLAPFAYLLQPRYAALELAGIALFIAAVFLFSKSKIKINTLALEDLEQSEVVQYVENNLEEFEEELFILDSEPTPQNEYLEGILEEIDINTLEELF